MLLLFLILLCLNCIINGFYNSLKSPKILVKPMTSTADLRGPGVTKVLEEYFKKYNPREVANVASLLRIYSGRESVLFQELCDQYGSPVLQASIEELREAAVGVDKFDWFNNWYPVSFPKFTDKVNPVPISILNKPLVLFYDHVSSAWRITDDVCPHRLVPLSEGRVDEKGCIECPYHGWSFSGESGKCTKIPQSPSGKVVNTQACTVATYPVVERQGLLFMYPRPISEVGPLPSPEKIPTCEPFDDPTVVGFDVSRDLP